MVGAELFDALMPLIIGEEIADVVEALNKIIKTLEAHDYNFDA